MKIYPVVDGAIQTIAVFSTEEKAKEYIAKHPSEHFMLGLPFELDAEDLVFPDEK